MASKRGTDQAAPPIPPPAGALAFEKPGWLAGLPAGPLSELGERHAALCCAWAERVDAIAEARESYATEEGAYRSALRSAISAGEPPPPRPDGLDPARRDAAIEIAVADAAEAREDIAECALEALTQLRANRQQLDMSRLSPGLIDALTIGAANQHAIAAERVRRRLEDFEQTPGFETFNDQGDLIPEAEAA